IKERLVSTNITDINKSIYLLMKIRNTTRAFQTLRGRTILQKIIPLFIDEALETNNPERALGQIADFTKILAENEALLEFVSNNKRVIKDLTFVFSQTEYLSRILMSRIEYVESILNYEIDNNWLSEIRKDLSIHDKDASALRIIKRKREIMLGFAFLTNRIDLKHLTMGLTNVAEAVIEFLMKRLAGNLRVDLAGMAVIGYGKFGAREMIFNSDLDIIFVTCEEPSEGHIKLAQVLLRDIIAYTKDGYLYKVDTRLRPDGSKGTLVKSIEGLRQYYMNNAHPWEIQVLIKARPIGILNKAALGFLQMRDEVISKRSEDIKKDYIVNMRDRIFKELSKQTDGIINVKSGRGGIMDIEFAIQYLQFKHCLDNKNLMVQDTVTAIKRLVKMSLIDSEISNRLLEGYLFLRTIETLLRLKNETLLDCKSDIVRDIDLLMNMGSGNIVEKINETMTFIEGFFNKIE
ncbi:MAG: hypothetical protein SNJ53_08340, partial [Thermodesulfovibrionales bacterium]